MRIAIIYNMVAPYQVPVFERLAARTDVELLVVYETAIEANRQWQRPLDLTYTNVVLDSWSLDLAWLAVGSGTRLRSDIYLHVPKHPLTALKHFRPDAIVASGGTMWASPTNLAALAERKRRGWAFVPRWETHSRAQPTLPRRIADPWVRRFFRSGDAWLAVGSRSERDLVRMGTDASRIFRWPMVSMGENRAPRKMAPHSAGRAPRYLFVGQLIERKGIEELLAAWRRVQRGELWIAGDGPLRKLVLDAAHRDRRIKYHGHTGWNRTGELYAGADVVVLPSRYDTWGLVVNEALIHGLPVIATNEVGAVDDLVEDGVNGVVIPPKDVSALESAMRVVASWPDARVANGAALSRKKLRAWTFDQAADGIISACEAGVDRRRAISSSA